MLVGCLDIGEVGGVAAHVAEIGPILVRQQGEGDILGRDRCAVRPHGLRLEHEGPSQTIVGDRPALRQVGIVVAGEIDVDQRAVDQLDQVGRLGEPGIPGLSESGDPDMPTRRTMGSGDCGAASVRPAVPLRRGASPQAIKTRWRPWRTRGCEPGEARSCVVSFPDRGGGGRVGAQTDRTGRPVIQVPEKGCGRFERTWSRRSASRRRLRPASSHAAVQCGIYAQESQWGHPLARHGAPTQGIRGHAGEPGRPLRGWRAGIA